jgi:hypothetical protein
MGVTYLSHYRGTSAQFGRSHQDVNYQLGKLEDVSYATRKGT